jgi:aromatic ring-opening dioxygenase LigB subunit
VSILPHGDFAYDPSLVNFTGNSVEIRAATVFVGESLQALECAHVTMSSPHGQALDVPFAVYGNSAAAGFAPVGSDLNDPLHENYNVYSGEVPGDVLTAVAIAEGIGAENPNVTLLTSWSDSEPSPLRWGEVIPLSYLGYHASSSATSQPNATSRPPANVTFISVPTRRYDDGVSQQMIPELLRLGSSLYKTLNGLPFDSLFVVSSDLAHTHRADGPYGYSPDAAVFDDAIMKWADTGDADYLLQTAAAVVDTSKSCGYTGLVIAEGILRAARADEKDVKKLRDDLPVYSAPTYYGMMTASWLLLS